MPVSDSYSVRSFYAAATPAEAAGKSVLALPAQGRNSFADYAAQGEYTVLRQLRAAGTPATDVLQRIFASGLRGCGGSHVPLVKKWEAAIPYRPRYLIVNGLEGEPFTFKDHFLLANYPQIVLEGIAIACRVLHIREVRLVINSAYTACHDALAAALTQHADVFAGLHIELLYGPARDLYVVGEETALLEYLEGRRAEPRLKPPFPHQQGLWGEPTVINNVETLCWIPILLATPQRFAGRHPKLVTLTGAARRPGIYEVDLGDSLRQLFASAGADDLTFVEIGGISGGLVPARLLDIAYADEALATLGVQVGSGTLRLFDARHDPWREMCLSAAYFADESCGRCTPCRVGTRELNRLAAALGESTLGDADMHWLHRVAQTLQETSSCGLGRAAPLPLLTWLRHFRSTDHD